LRVTSRGLGDVYKRQGPHGRGLPALGLVLDPELDDDDD
jgi:hypothetical protein